jgi:hypothetical protein
MVESIMYFGAIANAPKDSDEEQSLRANKSVPS